ncbi:MAG: hypothetical protein RJA29_2419 [Pseudomonadota bacterium]|jgi:hypothetical protein
MKSIALSVSTVLLLTACATGPRPVQILEVCPVPPILELDAPERDWQAQMHDFLRGTLPTPPDYSLPSGPASGLTMK